MEIAPGVKSEEWFALRLDEPHEPDWQRAVEMLALRLNARYIEPVDILVAAEEKLPADKRRFGFTILAIDLLLMETVQAFREGLPDTNGKSRDVFKRYLQKSPHFSSYFPDDDSRESFYKEFRCGILHQAEIQSTALLWSIGELYERVNGLEVVNRTKVHDAIKNDLEDYLKELREPSSLALRKNFRQKMDAIAKRAK